MIDGLLRACVDVPGVSRLFDELGYPTAPVEVDRQALGALGLDANGPAIHHLSRHAGVDIYASRTNCEADRSRLRDLSDRLAERNRVILPVVVEIGCGETPTLSILGRSGSGRRRLDVDLRAPSPDAIDRICGLMIRGREVHEVDPAALFERAFDRDVLGRRFLDRFRGSVDLLAGELETRCPEEPSVECRDQALLTLSRVLFVYLIQMKGWLDGDPRFLRERLAACVRRGSPFHASVIRPLFFDCLNRPRHRRPAAARRLGRIPYLNGGLFEPSPFERRHPGLEFSNDEWRHVLDTSFEPFPLSVSELDEEGAHVDPEMLGKVFETLMESEERARTGSFYTPRPVVDRMTRAAIVRWCAGGDRHLAERLEGVFEGGAPAIRSKAASTVLRRLETVTVLDPACGSGAFLLSALRAIEALTRSLATVAGEAVPDDLRARIAARSLHGVDLKPEAVRLCELRIWLAIVSGTDVDAESVPPLPNLDRNVMQGNSLVDALDFLADEQPGIYRDWVRGLRERETLLDAYRRSSSVRRRRLAGKLRESDRTLAGQLLRRSLDLAESDAATLEQMDRGLFEGAPRSSDAVAGRVEARVRSRRDLLARLERDELSFFSYDLHFATVRARGGFSIVLGNPPWVRASLVSADERAVLADRYRSFGGAGSSGFRQAELAMAFVERSLALATDGGVVAQLLPSKVTSAEYAREVRRALETEASVCEVHDWSTEGRSLFGADVFPLGLVARKGQTREPVIVHEIGGTFSIERNGFAVAGAGSPWSVLRPDVASIVRRLRSEHAPLAEVLERRPVMGVKTGANHRFFLDEVEVSCDAVAVPTLGLRLPPSAVVRAVRGRDVRRWAATDSTWMLWPAGINGDRALARAVARRLGVAERSLRLSYVRSEHLGLKVAWKDVSRGLMAALLPERTRIDGTWFDVVPNQTLYSIDVATRDEGHVLAALLNSTVANALALETAERAKDDHWRYLATVVGSIPMPRIDRASEEWHALARIGRRAESGHEDGRELNRLVARLYGVEADELACLEKFVARRLGYGPETRG